MNSEMGLVVTSLEMAGDLANLLYEGQGGWTFRVGLNEDGRLRWHATIDGVEVVETSESLATWYRRFGAWLLRIVPEQQL